jgi:hypothetical protein
MQLSPNPRAEPFRRATLATFHRRTVDAFVGDEVEANAALWAMGQRTDMGSPADTTHRLIKQLLDNGTAASLEEAERLFAGYRVCFLIPDAETKCRHHQAALLTAIALARRVFLGGVDVIGNLDTPLLVPLPFGATLGEAVERLGGRLATVMDTGVPRILIGGPARARCKDFEIRTVFAGWRGGIVPSHAGFESEANICALAPMLAAGFAVSEAFFHLQGKTPTAGRRSMGLSLWDLDRVGWLAPDQNAPLLQYLPSSLWLIGLGHLGQAYLWALGLLPYANPAQTSFVLQDIDVITPSTFSTSVLTEPDRSGKKKTREMAAWAEARGFETTICERKFDRCTKRSEEEPAIALCGLDNALGRQALDQAGFSLVVEAGLGRGHRDFRTMRLHTLPGTRPPAEIWTATHQNEDTSDQSAYQKMLQAGKLDQCGITLLAGKAVGAPFVGAIAACLAVSEVLRLLHGGVLHELIDLDLQSPDHRCLVTQGHDFSGLNPGFVQAATTQRGA